MPEVSEKGSRKTEEEEENGKGRVGCFVFPSRCQARTEVRFSLLIKLLGLGWGRWRDKNRSFRAMGRKRNKTPSAGGGGGVKKRKSSGLYGVWAKEREGWFFFSIGPYVVVHLL